MQTIDVILTIRWIESQISEGVKETLFDLAWMGKAESKGERGGARRLIAATHEMSHAAAILKQNPRAMEVLSAFGLAKITETGYLTALSTAESPGQAQTLYIEVITPLTLMTNSVKSWQALTTPEELVSETMPDNIISMEVRYVDSQLLLHRLASALDLLDKAYSAAARICQRAGEQDEKGKLRVVSVQSGSAVRADCRGVAEVVKHFKEFFFETWHKLRHKRPEELIGKNHAVLSSLAVMEQLEHRKRDKSLSPEESESLRRTILKATLALFAFGALPTDIPAQETVDNERLLASFTSQKMLPPAPQTVVAAPEPKPKRPGHRKSSTRTSRSAAQRTGGGQPGEPVE
jgi:hypothetical protein